MPSTKYQCIDGTFNICKQVKGSNLVVPSSSNLPLRINYSTAPAHPLMLPRKHSWQQPVKKVCKPLTKITTSAFLNSRSWTTISALKSANRPEQESDFIACKLTKRIRYFQFSIIIIITIIIIVYSEDKKCQRSISFTANWPEKRSIKCLM